jgi:endogenous inhibitor of DNA gyrase (YacG/DUF329 family)
MFKTEERLNSVFYTRQLGRACIFYVKIYKYGGKMGKKNGYYIKCDNCNKEVYQTKTQYNKAIHHFCSVKCQKEFEHKERFEDRQCEICGNLFHVSKKSTQRFCSKECQNKWQTNQIGEANSNYSRINCNCSYCNKPIEIIESNYKRFQNHFCDNECRQKWYSEVFSQSQEWKTISKIRATELLKNNKATTNTQPQIIINNLLDSLDISYINEKNYVYYSVDNYLPKNNLIIEVMGDYWHCNPISFKEIKQDVQKKRIPKDKSKHTYIKKYYDIEILYLWEYDIKNNIKLCEKLILEYISNNGVLKNYHSFNYHIKDDIVIINDNIIIPYQDLEAI